MTKIEAQNLSYNYSGLNNFDKKAIDNINVTIEKGQFIGLIGQTGSGKSTFVKHLNGLLRPTSGKIILNGDDIWENPKKIRNVRFNVGMVFQYPEHQLFEDTVYKDIAFGPFNMGLSSKEIEKRVYDALNFVGLNYNIINKSPFELSGGEKRRVAIAGVIAMDPEVLILDEPTAGLDPQGREELLLKIYEYHKIKNNTVILISHIMEDIARYSDKIMVLNKGKLEMFDETKVVFTQADILMKIGLEIPQITYIMSKLKLSFPEIDEGILTVKEGIESILRLINKRGKNL